MAKAKEIGIEAYLAEQRAKKGILNRLLEEYDDGGRDVFFCLAVNLLSVDDLTAVLEKADQKTVGMAKYEKAEFIEGQLRECADRSNIPLVLRKW